MAVALTGVPNSVGDTFYDEWADRDVFRFRLDHADLPVNAEGKSYQESITAPARMRDEVLAAVKSGTPVTVICRVKAVAPNGKSPFAAFSAVGLASQ